MKVIIFGAAGDVGSRIVKEALHQGHHATCVVRKPEQQSLFSDYVQTIIADISNVQTIEKLMADHDQIISAARPTSGSEALMEGLTKNLLQAARRSDTPITLVGGAARLKLPDVSGHSVLTAPDFLPDAVVPIAKACFKQYEICLEEKQAKWIYATPPAMIRPGLRTGKYRFGQDDLVTDSQGNSAISMEDFACAIFEQIKEDSGFQRSFTAAY